jgi:hypothetical protein
MTGELFEGRLNRKRNRERDVSISTKKNRVRQVARIAEKKGQAVVKVSSYSKSSGRAKAHLDYISRNGKLDLEDPFGNQLTDRDEIKDLVDSWSADSDNRKNSRLTANVVLSAPEGSDRADVKQSVREFARERFMDNHDYLFATHDDTDNPHVHLVVKMRGYNGEKLRLGKKELHDMRKQFAEKLRENGIDVDATYRSERGVVRKPERQVVRNIKSKRGKTPKVEEEALSDAVSDLKGQGRERPWEPKIKAQREKLASEFKHIAKSLKETKEQSAVKVADKIVKYLKDLPKPVTRHEELKSQLLKNIQKQRAEKEQDQER